MDFHNNFKRSKRSTANSLFLYISLLCLAGLSTYASAPTVANNKTVKPTWLALNLVPSTATADIQLMLIIFYLICIDIDNDIHFIHADIITLLLQ